MRRSRSARVSGARSVSLGSRDPILTLESGGRFLSEPVAPVHDPRRRRPLLRQFGGVLLWGLGVSAACLGAVAVLAALAQRLLVVVDGGAGGFPWLGVVAFALAVPFVAFILNVWARIAFGHRARPAR